MDSKIIYFLLLLCWLFPSECSDENQPDNQAPEVTLHEAQEVTRTSARLTGTVNASPNSYTDLYRFRYGTTVQMEHINEYSWSNRTVSTTLRDLIPGTTYYYCLEAGNKKYSIQSPVYRFTTIPNEVPKVKEITFLGQGPISILLQCGITDNGGTDVTSSGFCYVTSNGEEFERTAPLSEVDQWQLRIGGLEKNQEYIVRAFAENSIGRTYSEPYQFRTGQAVILTQPGTLPEIMDEEEKYRFTELNIAGPLNGTDIRFIREMLGKDIHGNNTQGKLTNLDLTDASIIAGGSSYDESHFTEKNVISYGMFGDLEILEDIKLPAGTQVIEQNAFKSCAALTTLTIPGNTEELAPSIECSKLNHIDVVPDNSHFSSADGVVYNKSGEILVWFPEGISEDKMQLSSTLKSIGDFALQKCRVRMIVLPNSLISIGKQAFYQAEIESIVLPDGIKSISKGLFQECKNLVSVTLGSGCESISGYCFDGCPLQHLYVKTSTPPVCSSETFSGAESVFSSCILYVPAGSQTQYRNHNSWKHFLYIKED